MGEPGLSYERFERLVNRLPSDSDFFKDFKQAYPNSIIKKPATWTQTDFILADIFDVLAAANWQRGKKSTSPKPTPYPRPVQEKEEGENRVIIERLKGQRRRLDIPVREKG